MFRTVALLALLYSGSAVAQAITDGSESGQPGDKIAQLLQAVREYPDLGAGAQLRGLHQKQLNGGVYYCGEALVGGGWQEFYWDSFNGAISLGDRARMICD